MRPFGNGTPELYNIVKSATYVRFIWPFIFYFPTTAQWIKFSRQCLVFYISMYIFQSLCRSPNVYTSCIGKFQHHGWESHKSNGWHWSCEPLRGPHQAKCIDELLGIQLDDLGRRAFQSRSDWSHGAELYRYINKYDEEDEYPFIIWLLREAANWPTTPVPRSWKHCENCFDYGSGHSDPAIQTLFCYTYAVEGSRAWYLFHFFGDLGSYVSFATWAITFFFFSWDKWQAYKLNRRIQRRALHIYHGFFSSPDCSEDEIDHQTDGCEPLAPAAAAGGAPVFHVPVPCRFKQAPTIRKFVGFVRAKIGAQKRTPANILVVQRELLSVMKEKGMRPTHINQVLPYAVRLFFVPNDDDLAATALDHIPELQEREAYLVEGDAE
jgi:hypothetical protein